MKQQLTYPEFTTAIAKTKEAKRDLLISLNDIRIEPNRGAVVGLPGTESSYCSRIIAGGKLFNATKSAHTQLSALANIPAKYYWHLHDKNPQLLSMLVADELQNQDALVMVRALDELNEADAVLPTIRAVVSSGFCRLDNETVLDMVLKDGELPLGAAIGSCGFTDEKMYLKLVIPTQKSEIRNVGDIVCGGVCISNSEIGQGALNVRAMLYELSCTNGATFPISMGGVRRTHIGIRRNLGGARSVTLQQMIDFDSEQWYESLQHSIALIGSEHCFKTMIEKAKAAHVMKLNNEAESIFEEVSSIFGLRNSEAAAAAEIYRREHVYSMWGVSRAITEMAQGASISYHRASELESIGAGVLDVTKRQYDAISTPKVEHLKLLPK